MCTYLLVPHHTQPLLPCTLSSPHITQINMIKWDDETISFTNIFESYNDFTASLVISGMFTEL